MAPLAKRLVLGLTFLTLPALAQQHGHPMMARPDSAREMRPGPMMMQGGMMPMMEMMSQMIGMMHQGMIAQHLLHRATLMAFVLPAMADTLDLSEQQQRHLRDLKQQMLAAHRARQQEIRQHRQALQERFQSEQQPDPSALRDHLQTIARLETDDRLAPYETYHQMLQVLNDTQRERLRNMQPHDLMPYMMRLPMMEMMPMIHMMRGHEGMGQMGMMHMMQGMPIDHNMQCCPSRHGHGQHNPH
jgi:hypothetical protein